MSTTRSITRKRCLAGATAFAAPLAVVGGALSLTPLATAQNYVDQKACEGVKKISLVLDYSGSMDDKWVKGGNGLKAQSAAVRSMIQGLPKGIQVQVVVFGESAVDLGTFTTGSDGQEAMLKKVETQPSLGGTSWTAGLEKVAADAGVVVLSSDGMPNEGDGADVAKKLRDRGAVITGLYLDTYNAVWPHDRWGYTKPGTITPSSPGPYSKVITPVSKGVETMFVTSGTADWAKTYGAVVEAACKLAPEPTTTQAPPPKPAPSPTPTSEPAPAPVTETEIVTETPEPEVREVVVTETVTEVPEPEVREVVMTETVTEVPEPVVKKVEVTKEVEVPTTVTETPSPAPVEEPVKEPAAKPVERVQLATTGAATGLIALSGVTVAGTTLAAKTAAGRRKKDEAA